MDRLRQVLNSPLGRRKNGITTPKVFGVGLDDLVKLRPNSANVTLDNGINSDKSTHVPFIVDRICRHIFANGELTDGHVCTAAFDLYVQTSPSLIEDINFLQRKVNIQLHKMCCYFFIKLENVVSIQELQIF